MLYTQLSELNNYQNILELANTYYDKLYYKDRSTRKLVIERDYIYMAEYEKSVIDIIRRFRLIQDQEKGEYKNLFKIWDTFGKSAGVSDEKMEILRKIYDNSNIGFVYGAAGTGKTTLINYIAEIFEDYEKIFLANTHPAVENLKHRVINMFNSRFYTVAKFINSSPYIRRECDILIIDECSTISNEDLLNILNKCNFKYILLVGDIYQIESIMFGNWFYIAKSIMKNVSYELTTPYRTKSQNLLKLWDVVRNLEDTIIEELSKNEYSQPLSDEMLQKTSDDEIVLCLNYDGLYGINNINRFMQNNNNNSGVEWGIYSFKKDDPILFDDSSKYAPIIYNNLKGKIQNIYEDEVRVYFDIEVYTKILEDDASMVGLKILGYSTDGTIIHFSINKYKDLDEDERADDNYIVPFTLAYAVSIHKSQGLEYDSVKIIITDEIEEQITHNIFYTAITRAREKLKIYWTPECEEKVIKNLKIKFNKKDENILKNKIENT